ncbi:MAG TPA: pitrilysin family protein [Thermoanaerobaculia bacterium]|nr:pitrilysin family protein [Thermoanaerobaculia bacterium]
MFQLRHSLLHLLLPALLLAAGPAAAQDLASFEAKTRVHTLKNGWTFILLERPVAPVFTFFTLVDAGSAQEVPGITGLAHMFEHMAFKGTERIGTTDAAAEKKEIAELEAAYQAYQAERLSPRPDPKRVEELLAAFKKEQEEAARYVVKNEFGDIIEREGGVGLNAFTASDMTGYHYSLPANKLELFAYLESERFLDPVFREFYTERDVVQEERRLAMDQPIQRLVEQFLAAAYNAHTYGIPTIGHMSDLQSFTLTDAERFYRTYYAPRNMITAVVGHFDADALVPMLEKYFGRIPAGPAAPPLRTVEPPQIAEKRIALEDPSQPFYLEGYHKPASTHPDQAVYDAIDDVLSNGRTSRLYRALVRDKRLAVFVASFSGFPGEKYPNLWAVYAVPARGIGNRQVEEAVRVEIERLKSEDVSDEELAKFKTRAKADLLRRLGNNQGLAIQLATYQRLHGDWRELFRSIERLDKVTKADIRRVANEVFKDVNRTVAVIETVAPPPQPAPQQEEPEEGR